MPYVFIVQSLLEVLNMSVADSFTVSDLSRNVLPADASIVNHVVPKRLVCMSPRVLPLILAVIIQPRGNDNVLSKQ